MRRTLWYRSLATLLAVWFPLIIGGPAWLPACPMHGTGSAMSLMTQQQAPANGSADDAAMVMHDHNASGASAATAGGEHQNAERGSGHHHCTCIDCCGIGMAAVLQPAPAVVAVAVAEIGTMPVVQNAQSLARPAPEYSRPFTTGPPRA